jgi:hypothetical protein
VTEWIIERRSSKTFSKPKAEREAIYTNYAKLCTRRNEKIVELSQKVRKALKDKESHELTTVFVTFEINNNKTVVDLIHKAGLIGRLRALCNDDFKMFSFTRGGTEFALDIKRAPEPEDIIWENIGHEDCATYSRKFFTFTATMLLLGTSFAIVFGLSKAQQSANDNRILSIAISVTISVVNVLLGGNFSFTQ